MEKKSKKNNATIVCIVVAFFIVTVALSCLGIAMYQKSKAKKMSLYRAYAVYELADKLQENSIKNKLKDYVYSFKKNDIVKLNMLDLWSYLFLCKEYNLTYDANAIKTILDEHYDSDLQLLDMYGKNDTLGSKILFSGRILETVGDDLGYNLKSGLTKVYATYPFKLPKDGDTLFNSGGDILYALHQNGLLDLKQDTKLRDWFHLWKDNYSNFSITNQMSALAYASFLDIATIFEPNFLETNYLMQNFYESFEAEKFVGDFEPIIWDAILQYVQTPQKNMGLYNKLVALLKNELVKYRLI